MIRQADDLFFFSLREKRVLQKDSSGGSLDN